jgi:chromosome segregation ATPase
MLGRLLRTIGLATRGELHAVEEKLRTTRQRLDKSNERLAGATAGSAKLEQARREEGQRYKAKLAERDSEEARRATQSKEALTRASQRIAALEQELKARDAELDAEMRQQTAFEAQVEASTRELELARGSLVSFEVKLDILEGAANTLDARLRAIPPVAGDGSR